MDLSEIRKNLSFLWSMLEEIDKIDLNSFKLYFGSFGPFGPIIPDNEKRLKGELNDYLKKMIVYLYTLNRESSLLQVEIDYAAAGVSETAKDAMKLRLKEISTRVSLVGRLFYTQVRSEFNAFSLESIGIRDDFAVVRILDYDLRISKEKELLNELMEKKLEELSRNNRELNIGEIISAAKSIPVCERILPTKPVGPDERIIDSIIPDDLKHLFVLSRKYFKRIQVGIVEISYNRDDSVVASLIKDIIVGLALLKIFFNNVHAVNMIDSKVHLGVREGFKIVVLPDDESTDDFEFNMEESIEGSVSQQIKINRNYG